MLLFHCWVLLFTSHLKSKLQNRAGLRHFLDSFASAEQSSLNGNSSVAGVSQEPPFGPAMNDNKHESKPRAEIKLTHFSSGTDSSSSIQTTDTRLVDLLDNTLWNRRLAPSSERIVYALVQQIFHGIREHFLVSAELKVLFLHSFIRYYYPNSICSPILLCFSTLEIYSYTMQTTKWIS